MSTGYIEETTALIGRTAAAELLPHAIRLLSGGQPVALDRLAAAAGWSVEDVEAELRGQMSAERDDQGRLVGLALTLRPTTHRMTVDGRTLHAWCATDTLMVPVILGRPAVVESTCPQTGQAIRIELTPDRVERLDPPDAVMTAVRPRGQLADVRSTTALTGTSSARSTRPRHGPTRTPAVTSTPSRKPSGSTETSSRSSGGTHANARRPDNRAAQANEVNGANTRDDGQPADLTPPNRAARGPVSFPHPENGQKKISEFGG